MEHETSRFAAVALGEVSDEELREEVHRRNESLVRWMKAYWDLCIPYAHGMRFFGQVYNDAMEPDDPYEFMDLLIGRELISLERNRRLEDLAGILRSRPELAERFRSGDAKTGDSGFDRAFEGYVKEYGHLYGPDIDPDERRGGIVRVLLEMAKREPTRKPEKMKDPDLLEKRFLAGFQGESRAFAEDALEIGRSSYALRDNDNHYLARIEAELRRAADEATRRGLSDIIQEATGLDQIISSPRLPRDELARGPESGRKPGTPGALRGKQFVGQPSGPGIATGKARVIQSAEDVFDVEAGEIMVCDSIEPGITFVVPLVAGIVERRGGMLIHGAIIARECGLPCVTGVPDATKLIETGQTVTVDGFLGIVTVSLDIPGSTGP